MYRNLRPGPIVETIATLVDRIAERFPDSGLRRVATEVLEVAEGSRERVEQIGRPIYPLRIAVWGLTLAVIVFLAAVVVQLRLSGEEFSDLGFFLQVMEAGLNDIILIGAALAFLMTVEVRVKRRRALKALHELRSLAHVIDMHQLTKDPERLLRLGEDTASSPPQLLTPFELGRYLDYCSELLAILSKIAALYAERFDDSVALAAIDEIEALTNGLSRKIWQKMMVLSTFAPPGRGETVVQEVARKVDS
ncbi:MAG: hypothetical protein K0U98_10745 [Deltaproteobacteria bacterium]|nr:hypothetical protein [Deltaproteobacteria bacterium]